MRLLHVVPTYLPARRYGGPIYSVHGLCKALAAAGHEVHVFTTNVDGDDDSEVPLEELVAVDGVQVWYFRSPALRRLYYSSSMGRALARQVDGFDLMHLHSVYLWPTWRAARAARWAGVPYVLSPRGMLDEALVRRKSRWLKTAWIKLIERNNIEQAASVHVTSQYESQALLALGLNPRAMTTIPNGVDAPLEPRSEDIVGSDVRRILDQGDYVLYLGRIHWKKGLDRLVEAWSSLSADTCRLVIAGNDEEGYSRRLKAGSPFDGVGNIDLLPRAINDAEKHALYRHARLFVLPSYSENFGNTVLEAMMHGLPVIVTREVGAAEVVTEARCGSVVDGAELAGALQTLLADRNEVRRMGQRGRDYARRYCSWDAVAAQMLNTYTDIRARALETNR